jgi:hypothetical protein
MIARLPLSVVGCLFAFCVSPFTHSAEPTDLKSFAKLASLLFSAQCAGHSRDIEQSAGNAG